MCRKSSQRHTIRCGVGLRSAAPPLKNETVTGLVGQSTSRVGLIGAVAGHVGTIGVSLGSKHQQLQTWSRFERDDVHVYGKLSWKVRPSQLVSGTLSGGLRGAAVMFPLHTLAEHEAPVAI